MKKLICLAAVLLLPGMALAQVNAPSAELAVAYSYLRTDGTNVPRGWNAELAGYLTPQFALVGDFSGHYKSEAGVDANVHTFLFGPRVKGRIEGLEPYAHLLVGGARAGAGAFGFTVSETSFALALGGGADVVLTESVALRLVKADYLMTRFADETQNNLRLSFGIVFRMGGR